MDIQQESVQEFAVGHGGAESVSKPIVAAGYAPKAYKSVRVRAATANTAVVYVGPASVTTDSGYPLSAGEELEMKIENPSKIYAVAELAGNSQQVVTLVNGPPALGFTLTLDGETTVLIPVAGTAAAVETALEAVVGVGNVDVTGADGGPYTVEFQGELAGQDMTRMTGDAGRVNEQQTISLDEGVSGGTFTLTAAAETTGNIAYDAAAADVQAALELLPNIGEGQVSVTGPAGGPWVAEFTGTLGYTDVVALTGDGTNLVGDIKTVAVEETVKGCGTTVTVTTTDASAGSQYSWIAV
jgi:hypothetical protein